MALRRTNRRPFSAPSGLVTAPQRLERSVPFVYDTQQKPAVSLDKVPADGGGKVSLAKGHQAATAALQKVDLMGLRMEVVVMVDGSGSMSGDYSRGNVQKLLTRALGFALNVDANGSIPVFTYGSRVQDAVEIDLGNYQQVDRLIRPDMGGTDMTGGFAAAMQMARSNTLPTMIINLTDGNPNDRVSMSNEVIKSASGPVILKNLALRPVSYLKEIDDLPSRFEIKTDANGNPVNGPDGNLLIERNPNGIRLIDNVDSKALDPNRATDEEFAFALADEVATWVELAARVGILTGVPGIDRDPALV